MDGAFELLTPALQLAHHLGDWSDEGLLALLGVRDEGDLMHLQIGDAALPVEV
jgi:hypothetical protein